MAKRVRRAVDDGEFQDPLKKYGLPYADEFERALMESTVTAIQTTPFETIPPSTTIEQAVQRMADKDIGCLLVVDADERLVGIFTQRDVLMKVVDQFDAVKTQPVSDLMTRDVVAVYETDSPASAINLMSTGGFRHIPVLDVDDRVVGMVGPRRTTAYLQQYFPADS